MQHLKKIAKKIIIVIVWLGIWQILSAIIGLDVLFPSPADTFNELKNLAVTSEFWISVLLSVLRISVGFICDTVAGVLTGVVVNDAVFGNHQGQTAVGDEFGGTGFGQIPNLRQL